MELEAKGESSQSFRRKMNSSGLGIFDTKLNKIVATEVCMSKKGE
jgi:hypothetical protein